MPKTWEESLTKSTLAEKDSAEGRHAALDKVKPQADLQKREMEVLGPHPSYRLGTSGPRSNLPQLPSPRYPPMCSVVCPTLALVSTELGILPWTHNRK